MIPVLKIKPQDRSDDDIYLLERCTSFLHFFEKVKIDDIDNKFNAHRRTCKVLKYVQYKKGDVVFKYGWLR